MTSKVIWPKTGASLASKLTNAVQGATLVTITILAQFDDGSNVDLSSLTLSGTKRDFDGNVTSVNGTLTGADGSFTWAYDSTDVGTADTFEIRFSYTDGQDSWHSNWVEWIVEENPAVTAVAGSSLEGVTASEKAFVTSSEAAGNNATDNNATIWSSGVLADSGQPLLSQDALTVADAGSALTIDPNTNISTIATLTEACTLSITAPTITVSRFYLKTVQDLTGGWAITWPTNVSFDSETTPTPSTLPATEITYEILTMDGGTTYTVLLKSTTSLYLRILDTSPGVFLPMTETSGTTIADATGNGRSGVANSDVSTWGNVDGPLGPALTFGSGKAINLLTFGGTDFATAFDWDEFSIMFFSKVSAAGVWTDSTIRYAVYWTSANGPGGIQRAYHPRRIVTDNTLSTQYFMNGDGSAEIEHVTTTTDWIQNIVTVSKSADSGNGEMKWYIGSDQIGATQALPESWTEAALTLALIGAANTGGTNGPWSGYIQGFAVWDKILTANERARILYGG